MLPCRSHQLSGRVEGHCIPPKFKPLESDRCVACGDCARYVGFWCGQCRHCWGCKLIKATRCNGKFTQCHLLVDCVQTNSNGWDTDYFEDKCKSCAVHLCDWTQPIGACGSRPTEKCRRCKKERELNQLCHLCGVCIRCSTYWPVIRQVFLLQRRGLPMDVVRMLVQRVRKLLMEYHYY